MYLNSLYIDNVRNLKSASFSPEKGVNYLYGENGSGKTSILEAIYLLSTGRSFRTHLSKELINWHSDQFIIRSDFFNHTPTKQTVGIIKSRISNSQIRLNREDVNSSAELARLLPVNVIHPDMHELIRGGPSNRRKFIDWGVFHVKQSFFTSWKRYQFCLKQRNELLKRTLSQKEFDAWTVELSLAGEEIHNDRCNYINTIKPIFKQWCDSLGLDAKINLKYKSGWGDIKNESLLSALEKSKNTCIRYKTTSVGPHRSDLQISYEGVEAKKSVSRGEQKLLVHALIFSQIELYNLKNSSPAVILCDDPEAELDGTHKKLFFQSLRTLGGQCYITGNEPKTLASKESDALFHVKHGKVQKQ
jgi:DNA replication and repair protein RecF